MVEFSGWANWDRDIRTKPEQAALSWDWPQQIEAPLWEPVRVDSVPLTLTSGGGGGGSGSDDDHELPGWNWYEKVHAHGLAIAPAW